MWSRNCRKFHQIGTQKCAWVSYGRPRIVGKQETISFLARIAASRAALPWHVYARST